MAGKMMDDVVRCSFCGKTQAQVRKLIAYPNNTYICDDCVAICSRSSKKSWIIMTKPV